MCTLGQTYKNTSDMERVEWSMNTTYNSVINTDETYRNQ